MRRARDRSTRVALISRKRNMSGAVNSTRHTDLAKIDNGKKRVFDEPRSVSIEKPSCAIEDISIIAAALLYPRRNVSERLSISVIKAVATDDAVFRYVRS